MVIYYFFFSSGVFWEFKKDRFKAFSIKDNRDLEMAFVKYNNDMNEGKRIKSRVRVNPTLEVRFVMLSSLKFVTLIIVAGGFQRNEADVAEAIRDSAQLPEWVLATVQAKSSRAASSHEDQPRPNRQPAADMRLPDRVRSRSSVQVCRRQLCSEAVHRSDLHHAESRTHQSPPNQVS